MKKLCSYSAVVFCALLAFGQARASSSVCDSTSGNMVMNCGFETGSFSSWNVSGNLQGGIGGNYIGVDKAKPNSGVYQAYFGAQSANQQTRAGDIYGPPTTLSQTLALSSYHSYEVLFSLDTNGCSVSDPGCPGYHNYFDVYLNGFKVFAQNDLPNSGGLYHQYSFLASSINGSSNTIQFDFTNDSDVFYFDDVVVKDLGPGGQTPEPATLLLIGPALAGLALAYRRRKV